jgi:hypothetical protein
LFEFLVEATPLESEKIAEWQIVGRDRSPWCRRSRLGASGGRWGWFRTWWRKRRDDFDRRLLGFEAMRYSLRGDRKIYLFLRQIGSDPIKYLSHI